MSHRAASIVSSTTQATAAHVTMTRSFAASFAALLQRWGADRHTADLQPAAAAGSALAALNQARRGHRHPLAPALRHRPRAARSAWPFPAGDTQDPIA